MDVNIYNHCFCIRRKEQQQELGENDTIVGDIADPKTLQEAMQSSDKLVM